MSLLTIYRVEDDLLRGPYCPQSRFSEEQDNAAIDMGNRHTSTSFVGTATLADAPELHPGPGQDPGMRERWWFMDWSGRRGARNYNFGFESTERLGQWFFGERETLELLNMHVAAYTVPHQAVIRGEWQLAFRRPSATLQSTMDLKGLVE